MEKYTNDKLLECLENYIDSTTDKANILYALQGIYGTLQGMLDFCGYFLIGNYDRDLKETVAFIADNNNQTFKEFVDTWLAE